MSDSTVLGKFHIGDKVMEIVCPDEEVSFKGFEDGSKITSKHIKVLIQNLLSLQNVSVIVGAGSSLHLQGPSLKTIPVEVECFFLNRILEDDAAKINKSSLVFYALLLYLIESDKKDVNTSNHPLPVGTITSKQVIANFKTRKKQIEEKGNEVAIDCNFERFLSLLEHLTSNYLPIQNSSIIQMKLLLQAWLPSRSRKIVYAKDFKEILKICKYILLKLTSIPFSNKLITFNGKEREPLYWHRIFIRKLLTRDPLLPRVNIFNLNYDVLFELAMDNLGIMYFDGFVGLQNRTYRPESFDMDFYSPADKYSGKVDKVRRVCRLFKLHGSISWESEDKSSDNLYGIVSHPVKVYQEVDLKSVDLDSANEANNLIIYPIPQKDTETILGQPYSDMFRHFRHAVSKQQNVLFVIGYGFGDPHVNDIIFQALSNPSFTIFIVNPKLPEDIQKKIQGTKDTRIYLLDGDAGKFQKFVEEYLPDIEEEEIQQKIVETIKVFYPKKE